MFRKEDIGSPVYLPEFGDVPCKITGWGVSPRPVVVQSPGKSRSEGLQLFTFDGRRDVNDKSPVLSFTPWTQRAVTERPLQITDRVKCQLTGECGSVQAIGEETATVHFDPSYISPDAHRRICAINKLTFLRRFPQLITRTK